MPRSDPARGPAHTVPPLFLLFSLAAFVLAAGCASLPTSTADPTFARRYGDFTYCDVAVVKQTQHHTCGPASLASVLTYWDAALSEAQLVQKYPSPEHRPYFLSELRAMAEAEGLKAYVISMDTHPRGEVEAQIVKGRPLICALHLPGNLHLFDGVPVLGATYRALAWTLNPRKDHFVVVVGLKPQKVLVMDPAHGFAALPWCRFEGAWSRMKHACLLVSN